MRVRLLIDDLYTAGLTDLLLGLAAHRQVELRLYNPFPQGRDSTWLRLGSLLGDFDQLNRRMHNKLLIAVGAVAPVLAAHFDDFWNSRFAVPLQALADNGLDAAQRRASFDRLSGSSGDAAQRPHLPAPVRQAMQALGSLPLVVADADVFFDSPDKTGGQSAVATCCRWPACWTRPASGW